MCPFPGSTGVAVGIVVAGLLQVNGDLQMFIDFQNSGYILLGYRACDQLDCGFSDRQKAGP
jgi:hypothetical protein